MKYLDENGLRHFWQKTKDYVDMNGGGGGGGSLPYIKKTYVERRCNVVNGVYMNMSLDGVTFNTNDTYTIYKNDTSLGNFIVNEMSESEFPTLNYIMSQMGFSANVLECRYITNASNWVDVFMGSTTGFTIAVIKDATMGYFITCYDNTGLTETNVFVLKKTLNIPLNQTYFEPVLLWEGESTTSTNFTFSDNVGKFSALVMVYRDNEMGDSDTTDKISFSVILNNLVYFDIYNRSSMFGYIDDSRNTFQVRGSMNMSIIKIKQIYGLY